MIRFLLVVVAGWCHGGALVHAGSPNVLLIVADDLNSFGDEGGNPRSPTPRLDAFRETAVVFPHASCAAPVCISSRAAFLSGRAPHRTGAYLNGSDPWRRSELLNKTEAIPEAFRRNGYLTWGRGKLFHQEPPPERRAAMWDNDPIGSGGFGPFPPKESFLLDGDQWFSVSEWRGPDSDFPDVRNANRAIEFLSREHDKPFFMMLGLWRPHTPWTAPARFFEGIPEEICQAPTAGYRDDDLDDVPDEGRELAGVWGARWNQCGASNPSAWRRAMLGYHACVRFADWSIGRVVDALDRGPHAERTIVIVTSDNGYHMGAKAHFEKATLWEASANVPTAIRMPDCRHAGERCERAVSLLDLYPTLVEACNLEAPEHCLDGISLLPLLQDPDAKRDEPAITTYGEGYFSARLGGWRYLHYPSGAEELYHLDGDPHEFDNRVPDAATDSVVARILRRMRQYVPKQFAKSLGGRLG